MLAERRQGPKIVQARSPNVGKGQKSFRHVRRTSAKGKNRSGTLAERRQAVGDIH